ncbi:MAG TPA: RNA ligase family protein [Caldisericia bacterium]|nr:RNA ligase family protein [Caldisericia bacterium]
MEKAVNIVTIKAKIPLFKGDDKAEKIELIQLEENGFELVSQKDLYQIGDGAIYIQPDYCLSNIPLFQSFIEGSYLGKNNRIRAKKFNFHRGDGISIYSNGILLPLKEVFDFLKIPKIGEIYSLDTSINLDEKLGITKYEEPETSSSPGIKGGSSMAFPEGIIRTDEENFNNLVHHIEKILPARLIGKMKIDGSSITLWYKDGKSGIASRNLGKPLTIKKVTGRRKKTLLEKILFWKTFDLNIYEEVECDSDFVKYGKPYLDKLVKYCEQNKVNLVLQGELCGKGMKGSGNKNNPHSKEETDVIFFNICKYENQSVRVDEETFVTSAQMIDFKTPKVYFDKVFNTIEEIKQECESIFKTELIEGIVIRDENHNFSTKYMNNEYDSKK